MVPAKPSILILGTRGVPAAHGGFETFAERLALFLVSRGWHVGVYCQEEVETVETAGHVRLWHGIERLTVQVASTGPRATLEFDWHCASDAARRPGVCLVLGYNGAVFLPYLRACGRPIITNMDGIEWRRPKWCFAVRRLVLGQRVDRRVVVAPARRRSSGHRRSPRAGVASRRAIATIPYGGDPGPSGAGWAAARAGSRGRPLPGVDRPHRARQQHSDARARRSRARPRGLRLVVLGR